MADTRYDQLKRTIEVHDLEGQEAILQTIVSSDGRGLNSDGVEVLFEAVEDISDLSVLKFLLEKLGGLAVGDVRNELNLSVVHLAALIQDRELAAETMQTLRDALGDDCFSTVSRLNSTAAHFAAKNSNGHEVLKWILDSLGPEALTVKDSLGDTAVHLAAQFQTVECMRLLHAKLPVKIWKTRGSLRRTPVHRAALNCAASQSSGSSLQWMLDTLEPDAFEKTDAENNTAIHLAARYQDAECMEMLRSRLGFRCFQVKGYQSQTAVHMAARNDNGYAALEWFVQNLTIEDLLVRDANGDTIVHIAAEYQDAECMLLLSEKLPLDHPVWLLEGGLKRMPAHRAALNEKSISVLNWMLTNESMPPSAFQLADAQGDTAVHLAALVQSDECMELLAQKLPLSKSVWQSEGAKGRSPIHCLATNAMQREFMIIIVNQLGPAILKEVDEDKQTAIHLAASFQSLAAFQFLVERSGRDSMTHKDIHGWTPLFMATANERHETDKSVFTWMMEELRDQDQELDEADKDGRTCLHLCARNRAYGAQMFVESTPLQRFADAAEAVTESVDRCGRNPLFLACLLKNFNFLNASFIDIERHSCIDTAGNSLLHALFLTSDSFPNRDFDADEFVSAVKKLIDGGIDPKLENNVKKNCLMSAEFSQLRLYDVLVRLSHFPELREAFSKLQRNSDGLHIMHVFSSRYDIRFLEAPLKQLFQLSAENLLNVRVLSGPLSGATCLHFACEAGHEDNLRFLIGKKLCDVRLACETASGQTCVDFACNKGKLDVLTTAATDADVDLRDILQLVDPVKKALQLPDRTSARNLLSLFTDPVLRSDIERDRGLQTAGDEVEASVGESADVKLLIRALELDSSEMLRSLVVLDYITDGTDNRLLKALRKRYQANNQIQQKYFPKMEVLDSIASKQVEISLLDCAIFFDKASLLSDLMVLPQFDIIPQTLRLLIHVTPKIATRRGRHEQLNEMKKQALNVLTNVLEQLYVQADEGERQLLFRYLTADFEKNQERGPKFQAPLRKFIEKEKDLKVEDISQQLETPTKERGCCPRARSSAANDVSVMQLIDKVDCDELFATDCLSRMIDDQWKKPPPLSWRSKSSRHCCQVVDQSCTACCSTGLLAKLTPSVRFRLYTHMIFFVFFLCFFSWYVTDFGQSLKSEDSAAHVVDAVMWMFAVSFTAQELNDMVNRWERMDSYVWGMHLKVPRYFTDLFNYFDLAAIVLLLVGLTLKMISIGGDTASLHNSQLVLSASFLLWGFRSVSLLSYFKVTGPKISMLKSLLFSDLAPFLMLVLVYSFGIFYVNLLFPATLATASIARDSESIAKMIFTIPVSLAFGFFEGADSVVCNGSKQTLEACSDSKGYKAYSGLLMFLYLLIVNIVMWNLLIALFNLTVTRMDTKAEVIWRKNLYEMLVEFSEISPFPPPISFPHYFWKLGCHICRALNECHDTNSTVQPEGTQQWWQERSKFRDYPEDYRKFLVYQAEQLRRCRSRLRQGVEKHRDAFEALRAHTEKTVDATREELSKMMKRETLDLREQMMRLRLGQKHQKNNMRRLNEQINQLQVQVSQVLQILQRPAV